MFTMSMSCSVFAGIDTSEMGGEEIVSVLQPYMPLLITSESDEDNMMINLPDPVISYHHRIFSRSALNVNNQSTEFKTNKNKNFRMMLLDPWTVLILVSRFVTLQNNNACYRGYSSAVLVNFVKCIC